MTNDKRIVIKMKDGKYQSYCKDKDYIVFAKMIEHRGGGSTIDFRHTVTFSNLAPDRHFFKQYIQ